MVRSSFPWFFVSTCLPIIALWTILQLVTLESWTASCLHGSGLPTISLIFFLDIMQNAAEKPPKFLPSWTAMYIVNAFVVGWVLVVGFGLGGWASMTNFVRQVDTFGLFAKCYQCPKPQPTPGAFAPQLQPHH